MLPASKTAVQLRIPESHDWLPPIAQSKLESVFKTYATEFATSFRAVYSKSVEIARKNRMKYVTGALKQEHWEYQTAWICFFAGTVFSGPQEKVADTILRLENCIRRKTVAPEAAGTIVNLKENWSQYVGLLEEYWKSAKEGWDATHFTNLYTRIGSITWDELWTSPFWAPIGKSFKNMADLPMLGHFVFPDKHTGRTIVKEVRQKAWSLSDMPNPNALEHIDSDCALFVRGLVERALLNVANEHTVTCYHLFGEFAKRAYNATVAPCTNLMRIPSFFESNLPRLFRSVPDPLRWLIFRDRGHFASLREELSSDVKEAKEGKSGEPGFDPSLVASDDFLNMAAKALLGLYWKELHNRFQQFSDVSFVMRNINTNEIAICNSEHEKMELDGIILDFFAAFKDYSHALTLFQREFDMDTIDLAQEHVRVSLTRVFRADLFSMDRKAAIEIVARLDHISVSRVQTLPLHLADWEGLPRFKGLLEAMAARADRFSVAFPPLAKFRESEIGRGYHDKQLLQTAQTFLEFVEQRVRVGAPHNAQRLAFSCRSHWDVSFSDQRWTWTESGTDETWTDSRRRLQTMLTHVFIKDLNVVRPVVAPDRPIDRDGDVKMGAAPALDPESEFNQRLRAARANDRLRTPIQRDEKSTFKKEDVSSLASALENVDYPLSVEFGERIEDRVSRVRGSFSELLGHYQRHMAAIHARAVAKSKDVSADVFVLAEADSRSERVTGKDQANWPAMRTEDSIRRLSSVMYFEFLKLITELRLKSTESLVQSILLDLSGPVNGPIPRPAFDPDPGPEARAAAIAASAAAALGQHRQYADGPPPPGVAGVGRGRVARPSPFRPLQSSARPPSVVQVPD